MNVCNRAASGLGIGSFVYLNSILIRGSTVVTPKSIVFVFLISAFVGTTTVIFDNERFGFNVALLIHYLCVACFVLTLTFFFFGINNFPDSFISLTLIYTVSYCVTQIKRGLTVKELNRYLEEIEKNRQS